MGGQRDNGYEVLKTYWFKYEPIRWNILIELEDSKLLLSEMILDSQEYNNVAVGIESFANASLFRWLNEHFYNTAFLETQKKQIVSIREQNANDCNVSLISQEVARKLRAGMLGYASSQKKNTDYSKCQGAWTVTSSEGKQWGQWWTRSVKTDTCTEAYIVNHYCGAAYYSAMNYTWYGVVPIIKVKRN